MAALLGTDEDVPEYTPVLHVERNRLRALRTTGGAPQPIAARRTEDVVVELDTAPRSPAKNRVEVIAERRVVRKDDLGQTSVLSTNGLPWAL
jgi:hypothetical protein